MDSGSFLLMLTGLIIFSQGRSLDSGCRRNECS